MIKLINIIYIIFTISSVLVGIYSIFWIYGEIVGPVEAEKLLKVLRIPISGDGVTILGYVSLAIMMICHYLIVKHKQANKTGDEKDK